MEQRTHPMESALFETRQYRLSAQSGYGFLVAQTVVDEQGTLVNSLFRVNAAEDYRGLDEMLLLSGDGDAAVIYPLTPDMAEGEKQKALFQAMTGDAALLNACLSPDGRYALLLLSARGAENDYFLRVLDMETLALRDVKTPENLLSARAAYDTVLSASYEGGRGIAWFLDNRIIVNGDSGPVLCALQMVAD